MRYYGTDYIFLKVFTRLCEPKFYLQCNTINLLNTSDYQYIAHLLYVYLYNNDNYVW